MQIHLNRPIPLIVKKKKEWLQMDVLAAWKEVMHESPVSMQANKWKMVLVPFLVPKLREIGKGRGNEIVSEVRLSTRKQHRELGSVEGN